MARMRQGASVVDQELFVFDRWLRYAVAHKVAAFIGDLARATAEPVGGGLCNRWAISQTTRWVS